MKRGWTSQDLPVVEDDDMLWTIADAVHYLGAFPGDPPGLPAPARMTKLRILTATFKLTPVGKRRTSPPGHPGRYARVYPADDFIRLYETMEAIQHPPAAAA